MSLARDVQSFVVTLTAGEEYIAFVQSWWSGNSNDIIVVFGNGNVYCRAEGEVMIGSPKAKLIKEYSIGRDKAGELLSNALRIGVGSILSQERPKVLSHFSRHLLFYIKNTEGVIDIAGGLANDERFQEIVELIHLAVPESRAFYRRSV